jgi:hypothetical protein
VGAELWNPHSTITLFVKEIHWFKTVATVDNASVQRSTAKGTAGSTVTPTIASSFSRGVDRPSGATLELATFSAQPTLEGVPLLRANFPAAIASGAMWSFRNQPIEIPPGAGLCIATSLLM